MLKNNLLYNENVKANTKEIELLKKNFSNYFDKNGEFLFNQFQNMLKQNDVILNKEGYELKFLGKSYARYLSSTKTETFIAPHSQHNEIEKNKNSENIYIIGDNIDALKHLLGSYAGKIKCIYIDPPYNTGSDGFIYPDNFKFTTNQLANIIGIDENEAERILNLSGKSSHSAWLTFMYPRLILARDLLSDDGVIFISIDDNEQANLKLVCDEIFGEENFVAIGPRKTGAGSAASNSDNVLRKINDFVYIYLKSDNVIFNKILVGEKEFPYNDKLGNYNLASLQASGSDSTRSARPKMYYPVYVFNDNKITTDKIENPKKILLPVKNKAGEDGRWIWSKERFEKDKDNYLYYDGEKLYRKVYKNQQENNNKYQIYKAWFEEYRNAEGTKEIEQLFNNSKIFDYQKPTGLIKHLLEMGTNKNSIILDFFSGSGTTAHAVMKLNSEDGGNRKYICVQIPEKIAEDKVAFKEGYKTIDEIGRKRIQLSAKKIKEETNANIDYGFKLYSLETLQDNIIENLNDFEANPKLIPEDMIKAFDTDITEGKNSILATWLVLDGYGLTKKTEKYKLKNFEADRIENSLYIIQKGLSSEDVIELVRKIETTELDITRVVIYAHSIIFNVLQELRKNLKNLRNNKNVELIERY